MRLAALFSSVFELKVFFCQNCQIYSFWLSGNVVSCAIGCFITTKFFTGIGMIKRFGFKNFASFKEGAEISFEFDGNTPESVSYGKEIGTVLGVKGANGSGKTNILKAITFLYCFCTRRMNTTRKNSEGKDETRIPLDSFFGSDEVTEFYIDFVVDDCSYYYEVDLKESGILREELRRKSGLKEVIFLSRVGNEVAHSVKEYSELKKIKLKSDQSLISLVSEYDFHAEMHDLHNINHNLTKILFNVGAEGYRLQKDDDFFTVSKMYHDNEFAFEFMKNLVMGVDDGISDISIEESKDAAKGESFFYPIFHHSNEGSNYPIGLSSESMGTKSLYLQLHRYWLTLSMGGLLVVDEFDTHLHAMILPEIIELFVNPEINKYGAQLIVTAHNTEILDALGRYRTVLVNKENNVSYCYRLDDVSMLRNDRLLSPFYTKGKIGGVPLGVKGLTSKLAKKHFG